MGIRNAGAIIKEARLRAGLTQEQLSFDICSLASVCNIETGKMGVSPSTFQALMSRAGQPREVYPLFNNRNDFDAFMLLKNMRLYADKNCLSLAYDELIKLRLCNYGNNKLYYQESLYLYARIKYMSCHEDFSYLLKVLNSALAITKPEINLYDFENDFLSSVECEIIIQMIQIYNEMGKTKDALCFCNEIDRILEKSLTDDTYTAYLKVLLYYSYSKCYFFINDYEKAFENASLAKETSEKYYIETYKLEILLMTILGDYCVTGTLAGKDLLYLLSLASYLKCGFVPIIKKILRNLNVPEEFFDVDNPPANTIPDFPLDADVSSMSDGLFDYNDPDAISIGALINILRSEQRLPMNVLCDGLCSVSKLSKIENQMQAPSMYLAEALLNRLGYSERDFIFYGNEAESKYWKQKVFLISKERQGDYTSKEFNDIINEGVSSAEPAIRQLCLSFRNTPNYSCYEIEKSLMDAIKISIPDFSLSTIGKKRLSWIEITILNDLCLNAIKMKNFEEAESIIIALCSYALNQFITPKYKSNTLLLSYRLRFKYLYNLGRFNSIIEELAGIKDEFMLKSTDSAADFFFYSSQAHGELKHFDEMIKDARIAAGYFTIMGLSTRKDYLLSELARQFNIKV